MNKLYEIAEGYENLVRVAVDSKIELTDAFKSVILSNIRLSFIYAFRSMLAGTRYESIQITHALALCRVVDKNTSMSVWNYESLADLLDRFHLAESNGESCDVDRDDIVLMHRALSKFLVKLKAQFISQETGGTVVKVFESNPKIIHLEKEQVSDQSSEASGKIGVYALVRGNLVSPDNRIVTLFEQSVNDDLNTGKIVDKLSGKWAEMKSKVAYDRRLRQSSFTEEHKSLGLGYGIQSIFIAVSKDDSWRDGRLSKAVTGNTFVDEVKRTFDRYKIIKYLPFQQCIDNPEPITDLTTEELCGELMQLGLYHELVEAAN